MIQRIFSGSKLLCAALILFGGYNLHASVAFSPMRGLTKSQFVKDMFVGWNLGNTMDASPGETGWGNPVTTQAMIDVVAKEGFKTMRLPVTWCTGAIGASSCHFGAGPGYTIDTAWLHRVVAIANYALNDSMYVIVNTHHDDWASLAATATSNPSIAQIKAEVVALWTQIANAFRNYSDYVIFEIFNEPNTGDPNPYTGGSPATRAVLDTYQLAAVNAIRATGGNNAARMIMLQGISASPIAVSVGTIPMVDSNILVSIHTYYPQNFCLPGTSGMRTTWGNAGSGDSANVMSQLDGERTMVATKGGVAVVGEWASPASAVLASRCKHAYYYSQQCRAHAMAPVWWDDGGLTGDGFGILNRTTNPPSWAFKTIADTLVAGARSVTFPTAVGPSKEDRITVNGSLTVKAGAVNYTLPKTSFVSLRLYTMQGKRVADLVKSVQSAGNHEVKLQARGISSGNYVLEFKAGNNSITKRLTIVR
jgi:endoglucanase